METIPSVCLPKPQLLFYDRAARFRQLAKKQSSLVGYLNLMADLTDIQHGSVGWATTNLPSPGQAPSGLGYRSARLGECRDSSQQGPKCDDESPHSFPLDIASLPRGPIWREMLRSFAERLRPKMVSLTEQFNRIQQAQDGEMETWAECLLAGELENIDPGLAPFLAAALQVYWSVLAGQLVAGKVGPYTVELATEVGRNKPAPAGVSGKLTGPMPETVASRPYSGLRQNLNSTVLKVGPNHKAYLCPVCGSLAVAGILQTGGLVQGLRFLCCNLCATRWRMPRIQCIHCGSSQSVAYFGLEGAGETVKAEACGECNTYIKLMNRDKEPQADPFADDLATLSLDILLAEEGYQRVGFNPLMIPGSESAL